MTDIYRYVENPGVPYYSQRESFLRQEGSLQPAQINKWRDALCGLMCAGMIINRFSQESQYSIAQLLEAADKLSAFDPKRGWIHGKIASLAEEFGIKANAQRAVDLDTIYELLTAGNLIMASVSPNYLHPKSKEKEDEKSGHLVVITGMNNGDDGNQIFIHDPSSEYAEGGENMVVDSDVFRSSFSGNIISFENPQKDKPLGT